jgi:hypothetical protein
MPKVLLFVLFLVAYVAWAVASAFCLKRVQSDLVEGKSFWNGQLMILDGLAGFFGSVYLLSGLWSLKLVLLLFITSQLGILAAWVLSLLLGAPYQIAGIRTLWAGKEFDLKYPVGSPVLGLSCGAMSWIYPIVAGILFFHHPWASSTLEILIVKCTLLLLSLPGYVLQVIVIGSVLASENLDDDTRQRIFISQSVGLIPAAIFVALAFWAFGLGGKPLDVGFLGVPAGTLSLQTLVLLLILFAATILIPFLVGTQRARRRELGLQKEIRSQFAEVEDLLGVPTPSLYLDELAQLRVQIDAVKEQFTTADKLLLFERNTRLNPNDAPATDQLMSDAIGKTRALDARFRFLDDLSKLQGDLDKVVAEIQKRPADKVEDAARQWSERFKSRKDDVSKIIDSASSRKPWLLATAGTLVSAVVLDIVSEVAKTGWQWIMHTPK